jgi:hypothetical protein
MALKEIIRQICAAMPPIGVVLWQLVDGVIMGQWNVFGIILSMVSASWIIVRIVREHDVAFFILSLLLLGKSKVDVILLQQRAAGFASRIKRLLQADLVNGSLDKLDAVEATIDGILGAAPIG